MVWRSGEEGNHYWTHVIGVLIVNKGGWILNVIKGFMDVAFVLVSNGGLGRFLCYFKFALGDDRRAYFGMMNGVGTLFIKIYLFNFFISNGVLLMARSIVHKELFPNLFESIAD